MAVRVRIYTSAIATEFGLTGTIGRLAEKDSLEIMAGAESRVPIGGPRSVPSAARYGRFQLPLLGAHRRRVVPSSATLSTQYFVENTSDHAEYVHEGTTGPIYADGNNLLNIQLGANRAYGFQFHARSVKGQKAQPWLRNAANRVLRKYGIVAGPSFR